MAMEINLPKPEELFRAAENGGVKLFASLSAETLGWARSSLLHVAASSGRSEVVDVMSAADPSTTGINSEDDEGWAPIHSAASIGHAEIADILLSRAASTGKSELCELLIEEGAEVDPVDKIGQTPLMHAIICQNQQVALLLIRHGANLDVEDKEGYTVLGRASDDTRGSLIDAAKAMLEG